MRVRRPGYHYTPQCQVWWSQTEQDSWNIWHFQAWNPTEPGITAEQSEVSESRKPKIIKNNKKRIKIIIGSILFMLHTLDVIIPFLESAQTRQETYLNVWMMYTNAWIMFALWSKVAVVIVDMPSFPSTVPFHQSGSLLSLSEITSPVSKLYIPSFGNIHAFIVVNITINVIYQQDMAAWCVATMCGSMIYGIMMHLKPKFLSFHFLVVVMYRDSSVFIISMVMIASWLAHRRIMHRVSVFVYYASLFVHPEWMCCCVVLCCASLFFFLLLFKDEVVRPLWADWMTRSFPQGRV